MSGLNKYTDPVWERFFAFVFPCEEELTRDEVQEELKRLGVNVGKAVSLVQQALAAAKGRAELEKARLRRPGVVVQLGQMSGQVGGGLRECLKAFIAGNTHGEVQLAYFHKLESAATDDDLQSLFDDIRRLDALSEDAAGGETRTS